MTQQPLPLNLYEEANRIMVVAPLPGMEPASISIAVQGQRLRIAAQLRGPGQERTQQYHLREWTVGPFERTVDLSRPVDAARGNASFDNGVLVVILPIAARATSGEIHLAKIGPAKGQFVGHRGQDLRAPHR